MRGKGAWDYRKPLISPKKSTLERSATPRRRQRRPGVWRGAVRAMPTVKTGLLSCCLRGRQHPGMCKNSDAALRLDSFAFVASLQKRTAETPGSQRFPLIALCVFCVSAVKRPFFLQETRLLHRSVRLRGKFA